MDSKTQSQQRMENNTQPIVVTNDSKNKNSSFFFFDPSLNPSICETFEGTPIEKSCLLEMIKEWNARLCISSLCKQWKKDRPPHDSSSNLLILLFNVQGLNTHITDVDLLLNETKPHICILTGVGAAARRLPEFPEYTGISQIGTNSFGGVAILYRKSLKCKTIEVDLNFLLIEIQIAKEPIYVGAVYVPPGSLPPFQLVTKYANKPFYIFGDFNAKHTLWGCKQNNTSGVHTINWLEATGNDMIVPNSITSRRSDSIIDFGISHDATGWNSQVLNEGTSDHWPILFQSPISIQNTTLYKQTNWKLFKFFLSSICQYWNSLVYNFDTDTFFSLFSTFLQALHDRCSSYRCIDKYRPPWPPLLVQTARTVNKYRRIYRRTHLREHLERFLIWKEIFTDERSSYIQQRREKNIEWLKEGSNIWKSVKDTFRPFTPPFRGLSTDKGRITDPKKIVEILADHYETHFQEPDHNERNPAHRNAMVFFENLQYLPSIPLEQIRFEEVLREWKKFLPKKSMDSAGTSAFILKQLPYEYLSIITVLFNKCAQNGDFFSTGKIAKIICLSKDGLYPTKNKLRPISLLPNLAKWFERIVHHRILKWCHDQNIAVDEQSGFMQGRRLQTRILSLVENLRLTVAACNRPALTIFVDFLSAFDRMWHPALSKTLCDLGMPLSLIKWIHSWLRNRSLYISYGDENSRTIKMNIGAPQGSVLAATLFRLHVHYLPSFFFNLTTHMFADDLAIVLTGSLEKRFSHNIIELEERAKLAMNQLKKFSEDILLPVNVDKTKALLVHSVVAPQLPVIWYQHQKVEFVKCFKYLGVFISTKLGWGTYIQERIRKIRKIYKGLRLILSKIPRDYTSMRRKIFLSYALPHFCWLFCSWFYFTDIQRRTIEHVFCSGLRIVYSLYGWDDISTMILSREKSLRDYIYSYWSRLSLHLEEAADAVTFQHSWQAYKIATSPDKSWYRSMGFRANSKFPKRLAERAQHTLKDWETFKTAHKDENEYFKRNTQYLNIFTYKYFLQPP